MARWIPATRWRWPISPGATPACCCAQCGTILADPSVLLIVDTPPGPSTGLAAILPMTDLLLTVLLADAASVALIPAIEQGRAYGAASASIAARQGMAFALNQVDPRSRLSRATAEAARRHLGSKLLGMVYRDENVARGDRHPAIHRYLTVPPAARRRTLPGWRAPSPPISPQASDSSTQP